MRREQVKEVLIIDADHLDEGYHGQVTDVNNRCGPLRTARSRIVFA